MSGAEDSDVVSITSDEGGNYILTPIQDGFDHRVTWEIAPCDLVPTNSTSVTSNIAQENAPNGSMIVIGDVNRQQDTILKQNLFSCSHKELETEIDDPYLRISVLEKKNKTLENQKEALEMENEAQKQQLEKALAALGVVHSKEEEFHSTPQVQQLWRDGSRQEEVENNTQPPSFQESKEDTRELHIDSQGGDYVVPVAASCDWMSLCNQQLTNCSNQEQMRNKHQMCVMSITDNDTKCKSIVPYYKPRGDLNGDGVLIAILGPPCKTDGVPEKNIILKRTVIRNNVQDDACEAMLLQMAYQRAPGAKYCLLQTTFDNSSMLVNPGVTAEALSYLVKNWPQWKEEKKLHTLIVIIPYGGKYYMDEEKAVNEACAYGIIIVAASGRGRMGIAFPAKLGAVISVAAAQCDGTLAPFSPVGRELDCVDLGLLYFGSGFMFGTGISTIGVATDLAHLFQHFSRTQNALIRTACIDTYVLRALFELIAGDFTCHNVKDIIDLPNLQLRHYIRQILFLRDRRAILPDPMKDDADSNTDHWSSKKINEHYKEEHKDFPHLSGKKITIAIIDKIEKAFLLHLENKHNVKVHTVQNGVEYFSFSGTMMLNECCTEYVKVPGGHGLQCAAIVANTAPNCTILMIMRNDRDCSEKVSLSIVEKWKADILLLSSVTTDYVDPDYLYNISAHLSCRIVLCAAGNEGKCDRTSTICYPSRAGDVIVIGACDRFGKRCPYSSCGRQVDFLCPGQFSVANSSGRGGTCYSTSAAAALIALLLEYIDIKLSTSAQVKVWVSTEEEFKLQNVPNLARNSHLMRALLSSNKLPLCKRTEHAITKGYGALLIDNLGMLTPDGISQVITNFHTD